MKTITFICLCLFTLVFADQKFLEVEVASVKLDPDADRSISDIITSKGYTLETHFVTTSDGYILKVFRIPKLNTSKINNQNPLIFAHGLLDSSDSWVANSEELSLPLRLVHEGYDAWLLNSRGNKHSNKHVSLKTSDKAFWNFSFHEMGLYDVPAVTDYILNLTEKEKLVYVGHSQGCGQFYVLCSLKPDYCSQKYKGIIALGPAVYVDNTESYLLKILVTVQLDKLVQFIGINSLFDSPENTYALTKILCSNLKILCNGVADLIADGFESENNQDRVQVFYSHFPSGTSVRDLMQFASMIRSKDFVTVERQRYPIENFKVPVILKIGKSDLLADPKDCLRLKAQMEKNGVLLEHKEYEGMGHLSFFMTDGNNTFIQDVISNVKSIN